MYGFVWELINDGKHAQFVDNKGRYFIDWQAAIELYYDRQASQGGQQKPFNRSDASKKLHGALLNHFVKDGAKEYKECRHFNDRNEVIKRQFQMPPRIFNELRNTNMEKETSSDDSNVEVQTVLHMSCPTRASYLMC